MSIKSFDHALCYFSLRLLDFISNCSAGISDSSYIRTGFINNPVILLSLARSQIEYGKEKENSDAIVNLKNILQITPKNIAAWKLLSIAEARNNNMGLAQLASAESYFLLGRFNLAIQFAEKARISFKKNSPSDIRALDIIFFSKEKLNKLRPA